MLLEPSSEIFIAGRKQIPPHIALNVRGIVGTEEYGHRAGSCNLLKMLVAGARFELATLGGSYG
jgi:hypothetical protein